MSNQQVRLNQELTRITEIIKTRYQPEKIIVFGSFAQGSVKQWSDLDIVVIKKTSDRFYDRIGKLQRLTNPQEAVDFLVYTPKEFNDMQQYSYFVREEILQKGRILYDNS